MTQFLDSYGWTEFVSDQTQNSQLWWLEGRRKWTLGSTESLNTQIISPESRKRISETPYEEHFLLISFFFEDISAK